jgi:predicted HTH domain antitoxin
VPVSISDEVLESAHLTEAGLKIELALALFQIERLTLAERRIPIHYGIEELEHDLRTISRAPR